MADPSADLPKPPASPESGVVKGNYESWPAPVEGGSKDVRNAELPYGQGKKAAVVGDVATQQIKGNYENFPAPGVGKVRGNYETFEEWDRIMAERRGGIKKTIDPEVMKKARKAFDALHEKTGVPDSALLPEGEQEIVDVFMEELGWK